MKKVAIKLVWTAVFAMAGALLFNACASAPKEEIAATRTAVASAQTEDARTYAPEAVQDAEETLNKALAEVETQDKKFALSRDYKGASDLLKQAKDKAAKAQEEAVAKKAKAKADAETAVASLTPLLEDAKKALATAPKGKDTRADLEAMQSDLKSAEEAATEASTANSQGKYLDALAKADSAKTKAGAIVEQVNQAKEKMKGKHK